MTGISSPISPLQSGSDQHFSLTKKVISNESAKERLNSPFNEVIISEEFFDSEKIKGIYNDLFYQISKNGNKSHTSIIEQSTDFIHPEINENLENKILSIEEELLVLNDIYLSGSLPQITTQHPIYDNGLMVQNGDTQDNVPINPSSDIWYIQQGFKRKVGGDFRGYYLRLLRQAEEEEVYKADGSFKNLNTSPNFRFLTIEELNEIPNGEDIEFGADINVNPITDQGDNILFKEIEITIRCNGTENFYKYRYGEEGYNYDMEEYKHGGSMGGYWYLDPEGSCKIFMEYNNGSKGWRTIPADKSITVKISRDDKFYGHYIKSTNDPLDYDFYQGHHTEKEQRTLYNQSLKHNALWKWKLWGPLSPLPSITDVRPGSRLSYIIKSPYNSSGNIVDGGGSHWLNAIIAGSGPDSEPIQQGHPEQEGIFRGLYNQESKHGTPMINRNCNKFQTDKCFGNLGQSNKLQKLFNDPYFNYYRNSAGGAVNFKVYGQPIIKWKGKYAVFGYRYRSGIGVDWNAFYDIEHGDTWYSKNKNLSADVTGYKRYSDRMFNWTPEDYGTYVNNPTLYFPGLQGVKVNNKGTIEDLLNGDRTFNNPDNKGSNDKVTNWMKDNLRMG